MSNYDKAATSRLGLQGATPTARDHKNSTVHVKEDESSENLTLSWADDRTDDDLKGETVKRYPDDYGLEGQLRPDLPSVD